jgi:tetratricopeptide (TPR) repeat protein
MKMRPFLAAILLCAALPLSANEEPSLLQRGETLLNEGKLPEALETLQQAVVADPNSSRAFQRLGGAQLMSQDYAGSILSFQRAIRLDANNAEAFIGMGMAYLHSGRYGLARSALEEAKRIDPTKQPKIDEIITWLDQRVAH